MYHTEMNLLVRHCLAKDPDDRVQTAHDVKLQLEGLASGVSSSSSAAMLASHARARSVAPRERLAWALGTIGLAGAAVALFVLLPRPKETEPIFASIPAPAGTELSPYWTVIGLSPDGRTVAFATLDGAGSSIWVRPVGSEAARHLPNTEDNSLNPLVWSYDSSTVAYFSSGKLKKVAVDGGSPVTIANAKPGRGGTWNQEGVIVFAPAPEGPLMRVSSGGGETTPTTTLDAARHETSHRFPWFLPEGDHFLYVALPPGPNGWDTFVGSLKSKSAKKVLTAGSAAVFAEPGYLVFAREGRVMVQRFDASRLELSGDAVAIGDAPGYSDTDAEPVASASRSGRLIILQSDVPPTKLQWLDRSGAAGGAITLPPGLWNVQRLSPEGRRAAVMNGTDIWFVDLSRSMPTWFAPTKSTEASLAWSPEGTRMAYVSKQTGRSEIFVGSADGTGAPEVVPTNDAQFRYVQDWSPDGKFIVFCSIDPSTQSDIWLLPTSGDRRPEPYLVSPYNEQSARVSPDGRWIAYASDESGAQELYVQSFPKPGHKVRVSSDGGGAPSWSRGGEELLYYSPDRTLMSVPIEAGDQFRPGAPQKRFTVSNLAMGGDVTANGERFLFSVAAEAPHREIKLLVNWPLALSR